MTALRRLRWAFSNRVLAQPVPASTASPFREGDWIALGTRELRKVWKVDQRASLLYVY